MTRLALEQAPAVWLPRRFLLSMPVWMMLAGVLLARDGDVLLRNRWHPATLALVHAYTLGVLGNAMIGSVLQFLPAAAGVRVRGGPALGAWLHAGFNLGVLLLVLGLGQGWRDALSAAALLLPATFGLLAAMCLPGLVRAAGDRLVRAGIGAALFGALATALLGGALALGLADHGRWRTLPALVDVHASWGVLGWVMLLLASVARVVLPMFLGTGRPPVAVQAAWLGSVVFTLLVATCWRSLDGDAGGLRIALVVHALLLAGGGSWLLRRTPRARRTPLYWSWRIGFGVLVLAALSLWQGTRNGLLAGALALAIALPLLVSGMAMEIVAFLGWIGLHRTIGRGVQLPGVQRLLPARDKTRALLTQLPPALLLGAAVLWPSPWLARGAGLAQVAAGCALWLAFAGVRRRAHRFLATAQECP
jgi:hypothetical protein